MPPRRARSVSVSASTAGTRKSTRVPPSPAPKKAVVAAPPKPKRARSVSVARSIAEDDDAEDNEADAEPVAKGSRKRKAPTPAPSAPKREKTSAPPKAVKIIQGINSLPELYSTFPPTSALKFKFPPLPPPTEAPRRAFVFGNGDFGQHGLGVGDNGLCEIKRPRPHSWFEDKIAEGGPWVGGIAALVCGGMHTLAIDGEGKVWSWGINDNAALGRSTDIEGISEVLETQPMLVDGLQEEGFKAVRVAAGDSVSLAISDKGEVRCWGSFRASEGILGFDGKAGSSQTQLKPVALPNLNQHTIVQLATGDDHFLALTSKGQVFACGNGEQNQLGRKIIQRHKTHGLTPERLALKNIVLVGSGSYHSFAVDAEGQVYAWGLNSFSQTGVSDALGGWADTITSPTLVEALSPSLHNGARVIQIEGGVHHSIFLFDDGSVWACGRCDGHETGLGSDHPAMKKSEERKEEALKQRRAREIDEEQRLGGAGMDGDEAALKAAEAAAQGISLPNPHIPEPEQLSFPNQGEGETTKIVQIAAGTRHNFAVASDGRVFSWGVGNTSQLGLGDEEEAEIPTIVKSVKMQGFRVCWAATGGQHSVVVAVGPQEKKE